MKVIDLCALAEGTTGHESDYTRLALYYQKEFSWLLNHAKSKVPEAPALYVGSFVILLAPSHQSYYNGTRCGTKDETMNFILNESLRLMSESKEVDALFRLADEIVKEPRYRKVSKYHLMGLKQNVGSELLDKDTVKVMEFQRANHKTLTKMKEACVRALLRGIEQPFEFTDDMDLSDTGRTYKSIFD